MEEVYGEKMKMIQIVIDLKVNFNRIRKMEQVHSHGKVGMYIMETILMMKEEGMERCIGSMGSYIKENGTKVSHMDLELCPFLMAPVIKEYSQIIFLWEVQFKTTL